MSAACASATATSPAAVPRRRLFTIFISPPCRGRRKWPFSVKSTRNLLYEKFTWVTGDRQRQRGTLNTPQCSFQPRVAETTHRSRPLPGAGQTGAGQNPRPAPISPHTGPFAQTSPAPLAGLGEKGRGSDRPPAPASDPPAQSHRDRGSSGWPPTPRGECLRRTKHSYIER